MQTRRTKRVKVKPKDPKTNENLKLKFEVITMTGRCCWKVWDSYLGGNTFDIEIPGQHRPGWWIRAIQLVANCDYK